jgi:hypothetical protein
MGAPTVAKGQEKKNKSNKPKLSTKDKKAAKAKKKASKQVPSG